jgi:hypothetical protein
MSYSVTLEQAKEIVANALQQRKQWGKNFTHRDLDPMFLDALMVISEGDTQLAAAEAEIAHKQIVLLNRQLGAARSRETRLRKQLQQAGVEPSTEGDAGNAES